VNLHIVEFFPKPVDGMSFTVVLLRAKGSWRLLMLTLQSLLWILRI